MMVADTPQHTFDYRGCTGPVEIELPVAGQYVVALTPTVHPDRGIVRQGGRDYYSSDFLPGETIKLVTGRKTLFVANVANANVTGQQHVIALPAGKVRIVPSTNLPYDIYIHRQ